MLSDIGDRPLDGHRFHILTQSLLDADGVTEVLARVEAAAREFIPAADLIGVTIRQPDGGCEFPVEVDETARSLDRVQYETGRGPCVEVTEPDGPACVASPDLTAAEGWPDLAAAATEHGYPAMVAVGVKAAGPGAPSLAGAISGYARRRAALDEPAQDAALLLGTHASLAMTAVQAADLGRREAANLRAALGSRDAIGQAKGVLMERYGLTPRRAFDALSAVSQHLNIKLAEVAAVIADGHRRGGAADPPREATGSAGTAEHRRQSLGAIEAALSSAATNDRLADQLELQAVHQPARRLLHLAHAAYRRGVAARERARAAALAEPSSAPPR
jgi:hypothetical protein